MASSFFHSHKLLNAQASSRSYGKKASSILIAAKRFHASTTPLFQQQQQQPVSQQQQQPKTEETVASKCFSKRYVAPAGPPQPVVIEDFASRRLLEWARRNGFVVNKVTPVLIPFDYSFGSRISGYMGRGFVATTDIAPGDLLVQMPRHFPCIDEEYIESVTNTNSNNDQNKNLWHYLKQIRELPNAAHHGHNHIITVFMMYEKFMRSTTTDNNNNNTNNSNNNNNNTTAASFVLSNSTSPLAPLLDAYPDGNSMNVLANFTPEDARFLEGTSLYPHEYEREVRIYRDDFEEINAHLFAPNRHVFPEAFFNYVEFKRMAVMLFARLWNSGDEDTRPRHNDKLLPFLDFFNHSSGAGLVETVRESEEGATSANSNNNNNNYSNSNSNSSSSSRNNNKIPRCVYASKPYARGEQVFISYGNKTNHMLLLKYGFVEEDNPNDCVFIRIDPDPFAVAGGEGGGINDNNKNEIEDGIGAEYPIRRTEPIIDPSLLERLAARNGGSEQAALEDLRSLIEAMLEKMPSSLERDRSMLQSGRSDEESPGRRLTQNAKVALRFRIGQRSILLNALKEIERRLVGNSEQQEEEQ